MQHLEVLRAKLHSCLQPLGIAFEEIDDGNGAIVVGFTEKSNGAKFGVNVGETLIACRYDRALPT